MHPYVWQSGRKIASSRVAPQDEFISLSQQQMYKAAGAGCFARSNEPCTYKSKDGRVELARKRKDFDLDVYGERRDNNISFGDVAAEGCEPVGMANCDRKEACTYKSKDSRVELACKQRYQQVPVPENTSLSAYALQRKEKNYGRQKDSLQDLSQRRRDA